MENIITVENVTKRFGSHVALDNVSLNIPQGGVYGLLGPNGAGKTTLIRIINHITAPDEGLVTFDGHRLTAADVAHIGYLPEERGLYKKMKVGEQAVFFARLKGLSKSEATRRLKLWFERLEISDWWNRKIEELSKGMAQKVQFIVTVLHEPRLLIFDEPFSGFDPINANLLKEEILRLKELGATVIFSTHNMASVEEICDNITLINNGRNVLTGNVARLRDQFSDGCYKLSYTGDDSAVMPAVRALVDKLERTVAADGTVNLNVKLTRSADLRSLVAAINDNLTLTGLSRHIASMNDIFINTVNSNNNNPGNGI